MQSHVLVYCGDRSDRLRRDDESGATEFLHAFREGGNASDKSSEELETLAESVEMGKKADDRRERERERGGFGAANPCVFIHKIWEGSGARWGREGGDTPWIIGPPAAVLPGLPLRFLNQLACSKLYYFLLLYFTTYF